MVLAIAGDWNVSVEFSVLSVIEGRLIEDWAERCETNSEWVLELLSSWLSIKYYTLLAKHLFQYILKKHRE